MSVRRDTADAMSIESLQQTLAQFAEERAWRQFHTPKNLAMALIAEAGELVELFQWLTPEEANRIMADPASATRVREEMADVLAYLLQMADVLDVDLEQALNAKIETNRRKYPADLAYGRADKYTELEGRRR
jgi:NTP pyrophosphatase (non-canonical NTP hydrolase)